MQAYAEGFDIIKFADSKEVAEEHRFTFDLAEIAEVWRRGSVVGSWLLDLTATIEDPGAVEVHRQRAGFRRRALDDHGGNRRSGALRCAVGIPLYPVPFASGPHFRGKDAVRHAQQVRRPRGTGLRRLDIADSEKVRPLPPVTAQLPSVTGRKNFVGIFRNTVEPGSHWTFTWQTLVIQARTNAAGSHISSRSTALQ